MWIVSPLRSVERPSKPRRRKRRSKTWAEYRRPFWKQFYFRRRSLPYHLVLRCYRRKGIRPPRLPSYPNKRRVDVTERRREKMRAKRKAYKYRKHKGPIFAQNKQIAALYSYCPFVRTFNAAPLLLPELSEGDKDGDVDSASSRIDKSLLERLPLDFDVEVISSSQFLSATSIDYHISRVCVLTSQWVCKASLASPVLVFDTGASFDISPYISDFISYKPLSDVTVQGIGSTTRVHGVGVVMYRFTTRSGTVVYRPSVCYHMPAADIRLLSPHSHMKMYGGSAAVDGNNVAWKLPPPQAGDNWIDGDVIDIPIDPRSNLPMIRDFLPSKTERNTHSDRFKTELSAFIAHDALREPDVRTSLDEPLEEASDSVRKESLLTLLSVADETNQNLQPPQKELLMHHWRLGVNMQDLQTHMKPRKLYDDSGNFVEELPPAIKTKYKSTPYCVPPVCLACKLANLKNRSKNTTVTKAIPEKEGSLSRDADAPGKIIHTDQFNVSTPGRLLKGYGREGHSASLHGGTSYSDAYSRYKYICPQVSMSASETVMGKAQFEEELSNLSGAKVKRYHSDNGIFDSAAFRQDCKSKQQTQTFSAVGAKHQNGVAERDIQTISSWARHMMVHASLHWPNNSSTDISRLWGFAMEQAVFNWNHLPNKAIGNFTPMELLTGMKSDHLDLSRVKTWGCPVFVLDPTLQDGKKLPKFQRRSRMGQNLGFSKEHSSLTGLVRNLRTNYVSPQFHVVYDELFTTIANDKPVNDEKLENIFEVLWSSDGNTQYFGEESADDEEQHPPAANSETNASDQASKRDQCSPLLQDEWLNEAERSAKQDKLAKRRQAQKEQWDETTREFEQLNREFQVASPTPNDLAAPPPIRRQVSFDSSSSSDDDDDSDDDVDEESPSGATMSVPSSPSSPEGAPPPSTPNPIPVRRSQRSRREYNRGTRGLVDGVSEGAYVSSHPDYQRCCMSLVTDRHVDYDYVKANPNQFQITLSKERQQPPVHALYGRISRKRKHYKARLARKKLKEAYFTQGSDHFVVPSVEELMQSDLARFCHLAAVDSGYSGTSSDLVVEWLHPLLLAAKANANKEDYPNWWQAMNGPFAEEFWQAAVLEIETLEKMDTWDVVERTDDMEPLPTTWAMRIKRFPDGLIKKMKARLCARGDLQKEGIHYHDTLYAPVVQWTTVRIMLILECLLDLKSKQGDVKCAFLHSKLNEDENYYLEMPQGFKQYGKNGRAKVLKLKRHIYGLRQSPRAFWQYMVDKMAECDMVQSELDPCLFVGTDVIAVIFVDDILMWSRNEESIASLGINLRQRGVDLEEESDSAGFLGIDMKRVQLEGDEGVKIVMTQKGLIDRILVALGLDDTSTPKHTPCLKKPLVKDADGDPIQGSFSYSSILGMMLYLSGNTRPDIAYSVHCAARFAFCPKKSHEDALKRIGRYLLATRDKGMVITPNVDLKVLKVDAFPDSDFSGLYGHEDINDPVVTRSRTGMVINVADTPVLWKSQLQSETATSTMEAEIVAMASCCRELFPILDMVEELSGAVGLSKEDGAKMHIRLHEDNAGALVLAQTIPSEFTPRSKHYAIKTNWFREQIAKRMIELVKCPTTEMLGDIFTKCLPQPQFEYLRKKLMGW